ncbi:hypothetical protein WA158_007275 [Blastocystis sp. Blastoise]
MMNSQNDPEFESVPDGPADVESNIPLTQTTLGSGRVETTVPVKQVEKWSLASLTNLKPYFNVDTKDVYERLLSSVNPKSEKSIMQNVESNPDLYGPFWISTTIIVLIGAVSNILTWFFTQSSSFKIDMESVYSIVATTYIYTILSPLILWCLGNINGVHFSLTQYICLFGYSLTPFLVAALICIIPGSLFHFIILTVAAGLSIYDLLRDLYHPFKDNAPLSYIWISGIIIGLPAVYALYLRLFYL